VSISHKFLPNQIINKYFKITLRFILLCSIKANTNFEYFKNFVKNILDIFNLYIS